jgi:Reverse transcriptase (RNA-dependent DNA polymerase)
MDNTIKYSLENLSVNPDFDFLQTILNSDNEDGYDFSCSPYDVTNLNCSYIDEFEYAKLCTSKNEISLLSLNIQSLSAKFTEFSALINHLRSNNCEPDVVCIQELWQFPNEVNFSLFGYHPLIYTLRRNNVQGGGVGIYVKNTYQFNVLTHVSIFQDRLFESIFCEIAINPNKKIIVGSIYRPTLLVNNLSANDQFNQFCEILSNINFELQKLNLETYFLGDFNIDVLKYNSCNNANTYVDLLFSLGLIQIITKPTRCTPHSATLIDHVCTNSQSPCITSNILISHISDHFPIIVKIKDIATQNVPKYIEFRDFSAGNTLNFNTALRGQDWNHVLNSNDTQEAYNLFSDTFFNLYNLFFPLKRVKFNKNVHFVEKWMSAGLLISRKNKILLGKKCANNPNVANILSFKNYRNLYNRTVRAAKKMYYDSQLKKNQTNLKKTWELIFEVIKKSKSKSNEIFSVIVDNTTFSDPKQIANKFNEYFTGIAEKISSEIHPATLPPEFFNPAPEQPEFDFMSTPVSCSEISECIDQLQRKKTLDFNGLSTIILAKCSLTISTPLRHVISLSLTNGTVPVQLKIAKVIPLHKSGDKLSLDNYRPISLLNVFSKVLEKVVYNRLSTFLNINNILSNCQFGFRKNHATIHPLTLFTNSVSNSLNSKKHAIAIFCDLKKAFDTVDHTILLKKLKKIGVSNVALNWFSDYLTNRQQFVCIGSVSSQLRTIKFGVPQGSILGPLLFLIYINDLPTVSSLINYLFADDTTLLYSHSNLDSLISTVNTEFRKIVHFFRAHKMCLHPQKTKFILFTNSHTVTNSDCNIVINCNNEGENYPDLIFPIERVTANSSTPAIKFLGLYIDPDLSFKFHINTISGKMSRALYFIRSAKNFLSHCALKSLYYALVHCHLIYGIQIWSCTSESNLHPLVIKQKAAIRLINFSSYNAHTEPLFKNSNILPLHLLIKYFKLQFMQHYKFDFLPSIFSNTWQTNEQRLELNLNMQLRNYDEYFVPFARTLFTERCPLFSFPKIWNNFESDSIKSISNKLEFNAKLKEHFMSMLDSNYGCNRLLCPHCHLHN